MELSWSISCINYWEPLLWFALATGAFLGVVVGTRLVRVFRRQPTGTATLALLPLFIALPLALLVSFASLAFAYAIVRGGNVCTHFVRPAFILPLAVTAVGTLRAALRPREGAA